VAIDAVDNAVVAKLQGDATLLGLAPGNVYMDFAPEGAVNVGRFVIVDLQLETPVYEQSAIAHLIARFQVKVVDRSTTKTAAQAALDRIDTLLHLQPLTIAGHTHMVTNRVGRFHYIERDGPLIWQHRGIDVEVWSDP
jgi:hypothetical protein